MKKLPDFSLESRVLRQGYTVIGIDEVGRGSLAGPITVGGVCFLAQSIDDTESQWQTMGINDSKKLSPAKREKLYDQIRKLNPYCKTVSISVPTINTMGIVYAWKLAIAKIIRHFRLNLQQDTLLLLIDGPQVEQLPYNEATLQKSVIKGDCKCISIASASILAKVTRDMFMTSIGRSYPQYEWSQNKGYGTKKHRDAIRAHGASPWHRKQFIRSLQKS